uniref:DNA-directed RNA polymerase n=1 Tax=viral metagenome TaxID=1070528 RepID=A0A6C0HYU2_9ZZZZ
MADFEENPGSDMSDVDSDSDTSSVGIIKKPKKMVSIGGDPDDDDDIDLSDVDEDSEKDEAEEADDEVLDDDDASVAIEKAHFPEIEDDEDEEDEDDEDYLKKFDESLQQNVIRDHHPELQIHNYEEIDALCTIVRDEKDNIIDPFHKTLPIVTRYERARVLGERAKQIDAGAPIFIEVDDTMIDGYIIALKEFEEKKIPFIIQRPLPNGACEYWRLSDLEIL